jgi:hypothetical protein
MKGFTTLDNSSQNDANDPSKSDNSNEWEKEDNNNQTYYFEEFNKNETTFPLYNNSEIVVLDVGGVQFKTTISTLSKYPRTYFSGLFSGKIPIKKQEDGSIFVDRDGTHFRALLNFLRSGRIIFPKEAELVEEILVEAEFYCLKEYILESQVSLKFRGSLMIVLIGNLI